MPKTFRIGDTVEYDSPRGKARGVVKQKLTRRTRIKDQDIDASEDDPRYVVANNETGEEEAYKPDSLDTVD